MLKNFLRPLFTTVHNKLEVLQVWQVLLNLV